MSERNPSRRFRAPEAGERIRQIRHRINRLPDGQAPLGNLCNRGSATSIPLQDAREAGKTTLPQAGTVVDLHRAPHTIETVPRIHKPFASFLISTPVTMLQTSLPNLFSEKTAP